MIARSSPNCARRVPLAIGLLALSLFLVACQKNDEAPWSMTQPRLHWLDERGMSKTSNVSTPVAGVLNMKIHLEFDSADRGLGLTSESVCQHQNLVLVEPVSATTAERLPLDRLLPGPLLSPVNENKTWSCRFKIKVSHPNGSSHMFEIQSVSLFVPTPEPLPEFQPEPASGTQNLASNDSPSVAKNKSDHGPDETHEVAPIGIACDGWSSRELSAPATKKSLRERIDTLAASQNVVGVDTRPLERRPLCTVFADHPSSRVRLGKAKAQFRPPGFSLSLPAALLSGGDPSRYTRQPILRWRLSLDDDRTTTLAIPRGSLLIRMVSPGYFQTAPIRVPYEMEYRGALSVRKSESHDFVSVIGHSMLEISMRLDRSAWCSFSPESNHLEIPRSLYLTAPEPLLIQTLSGETSSEFDRREQKSFFTPVLLTPNPLERKGTMNVSSVQDAPIEPGLNTTGCVNGDQFSPLPKNMIPPEN